MNLRTTFTIRPSASRISHDTPVMFTGSCFASEIGNRMAEGKMNVMVNPSGTVYNPVSIGKTLNLITENRMMKADELFSYNGRYMSFLHYTDFTSEDPLTAIEKINKSTHEAHQFLKNASFLFITFGTARVYRLVKSGQIVSNCHKLPQDMFLQEMLTVEGIVKLWTGLLDILQSFNSKLKVIFTISPVRHWKDGPHYNQLSKSVLFLSTEELLKHPIAEGYFPAYELVMDDLRDYRFYADDMLHPSATAIDYVWDAFTDCYFEPASLAVWKEVRNICKSVKHRISNSSPGATGEFASTMLARISSFSSKNPGIDFSGEIAYFKGLGPKG
jgi:hypothetical protein